MRKKEGYREINLYLPDEDYEKLEKYWRFYTKDKHITATAAELLRTAIRTALETEEPQN